MPGCMPGYCPIILLGPCRESRSEKMGAISDRDQLVRRKASKRSPREVQSEL